MSSVKRCIVEGCTSSYRSGGYCIRHREEALSSGELTDLRYRQNRPQLEVVMCRVDGCEQIAKYRGKRLCMKHYLRIWTYGSTELPQPPSLAERLESGRQVSASGCWEWRGTRADTGYGRIGGEYTHRLAYEHYIGAIPEGYQIDHLCLNRSCFNPEHLEAVTQYENLRRQNERMRRDDRGRIIGAG